MSHLHLVATVAQSYISYERDSQLKEDAQIGRCGVAAQEAVSVQEGREDAGHLESTNTKNTELVIVFCASFSEMQIRNDSETAGNSLGYLWREAPGFGVLGVIRCSHCVDVAQNLE